MQETMLLDHFCIYSFVNFIYAITYVNFTSCEELTTKEFKEMLDIISKEAISQLHLRRSVQKEVKEMLCS